jgi:clan AA aspartic protease
MISGTVDARLQAAVTLHIFGSHGLMKTIDVVIDTGYNGYLSLPSNLISALQLKVIGNSNVQLADGTWVLIEEHEATVLWDSKPQPVIVDAANTPPTLGTALLHGYTLTMQVVDGGKVEIESLSTP